MPTISLTPRLLDTDTSLLSLPPDRTLSMRNLIPELGYTGLAAGTIRVGDDEYTVPGRCRVVGVVADPKGQSLVRWVWNELGVHRLLRTYVTGRQAELLRAPQLDLREDDLISQAGIIGEYVGWLDRDGLQYRLSMSVAEAGGYAGIIDPYFFRLARRVPLYAPTITRGSAFGSAGPNRIQNTDWQLAYRYGYAENDVTVLSPPSVVNRATKESRDSNALFVRVPIEEVPSVAVQRIEFYARKNNNPIWQKVKTLRRDAAGAFPVEPNIGFLVGFIFSGQTLGDTLSDAEADKLVEAIPRSSRAMGAADNRFFLGDNTEGYPPTTVALSASVEASNESFNVSQRLLFRLKTEAINDDDGTQSVELYTDFILVRGSQGASDARYVNAAYNQFLTAYFEVAGARTFTYDELLAEAGRINGQFGGSDTMTRVTDFASRGPVPYILHSTIATVKSLSAYQLGVEFVDFAGQSSGTLTSDSAVVRVPELDLSSRAPTGRRIRWSLPASTLVPDWAVAYRIVWTPNQEASAFKQLHVAEVLRLEKNGDASKPRFVSNDTAGGPLWLDISPLTAPGQGYVWSAESNDRVRIYESPVSTVFHDYKIIGQLGGYLQVDEPTPVNYARTTRVEIYSPRDAQADVFYSAGPSYPIVQDASGTRVLSTLTDVLAGDVFLTTDVGTGIVGIEITKSRFYAAVDGLFYNNTLTPGKPYVYYNGYYDTKNELPRTKHYGVYSDQPQQLGSAGGFPMGAGGLPGFFEVVTDVVENSGFWLNDRGRPSTVLADGPPLPALREVDVRWGGVLKPGSEVNGLSSWEEESIVTLGQERGRVVALKLAVQQQETGTVLLAVQAYGYSSLYLGEAVLTQPTGESLRADTTKVVGTVRGGAGNKGSEHPGSVTPWEGRVYMWSQQAKTVLRYDQSGITDLCETYRCQKLGRELAALTAYRIVGGYDPEAEVFFLTFHYYDAGLAATRTIGFSERGVGGRDKGFCGDYDFASSCYTSLGEYLYSFLGEATYRHDPLAPRTTFYGELYQGLATAVANPEPRRSKSWLSLAYHGTDAWDTPLLENEQAGGVQQRSRTSSLWAKWRLGTWTVALRRNMLKPVHGPDAVLVTDPVRLLHVGESLQSPWLLIQMVIKSDKAVRLDMLDVNFNLLTGQQAVPNG